MSAQLIYKYGTIYREVMHTPHVNICEFLENKNDNKMLAQILTVVTDNTAPGMIHKCPYQVKCSIFQDFVVIKFELHRNLKLKIEA